MHVTGLSLLQLAGPTGGSQPGEESHVPCLEWGYPATPWVVRGGAGDCSGCGGPCEPGESFEAGVGGRCLSAVRADGCRSFGSHLEAPRPGADREKASGLGSTPRHGRVPSPPTPALGWRMQEMWLQVLAASSRPTWRGPRAGQGWETHLPPAGGPFQKAPGAGAAASRADPAAPPRPGVVGGDGQVFPSPPGGHVEQVCPGHVLPESLSLPEGSPQTLDSLFAALSFLLGPSCV